jgi:V/A-type H+/Na+-transporting ATPase subunit I
MIVPMKKYTFLVYHADYQKFLEELRQLGVVDVVERTKDLDDETRDQLLEQKQIADTIKLLQRRKVETVEKETTDGDGIKIVEKVRELIHEQENLEQQLVTVNKEINNLEPWGDFSLETLKKLRKAGLNVSFHITSTKKYNPGWENQYNIGVVNTAPPYVYFILVRENDEQIELDAEEIKTPERPLSEVIKRREAIHARIAEIGLELDEFATASIPLLKETLNHLATQTDYKKVLKNTQAEADEKVMMLQGFVPKTSERNLVRFCEERYILYLEGRPEEKDKIPILLQNSRFSELFEPISKLFSLPSYTELDLTPLFAPFFMMFFGFCLGDAGYGLLILLGATLYKPKAKPSFKPYLSLAQFLGVGTIIFGVISGTFFGINLIKTEVTFLDNIRAYFLDEQQMFYLALMVGGVQIIFGMFVKVFNITRQRGFAYALSTVGWLIIIFGMLGRQALMHYEIIAEGEKLLLWSVLGVGGIFVLLLNDPRVNVFVRIGKGVWDVYGTVTGIFGDLLSYIRLFALGISSAILGLVINSIGLDMLGIPYIGPIIFVLFLTVGHLANILISSLGAFVHPMRLTFVEFYKNAGFSGGGKAYKPFAEKGSD